MNKHAYKLAASVAGSAMLLSLFATSVLADSTISGNGAGSNNTIVVTNTSNCLVLQGNATLVLASVSAKASTGGNKANGNTGGDVTIDTGDASATSTMTVTGGDNSVTNPCCCMVSPVGPADPTIKGNGKNSVNTIVSTETKNSATIQVGITGVAASVKAKAKTGKNKANSNTGKGAVEITTGKGTSSSTLEVTGGSNSL